MTRIALITTSYPAHPGDASGHFVAAEAEELASAGHDVRVLCPGRGRAFERSGVRIVPCGGGDAFGWPGVAARLRARPQRLGAVGTFVGRAHRAARELDVDVVVAHWMTPSAWPIARDLSPNTALDVMCHGGDVRLLCQLPSPVRHRIVDHVLARARCVRFAGAGLRDELSRSLPTALAQRLEDTARVQAPPIRVPSLDPAARRRMRALLAPLGDPLVCVIARLVPSKRVAMTIRALRGVACRLVVVGDGPERRSLERLAEEQSVAVRFAGRCDRVLALTILSAADLLVSTSRLEGAPTAIREARLLDIPVIATRAGDVALWAETDAGVQLTAADPDSVRAAISMWLETARVASL